MKDLLLGGWTITPVFSLQSGFPMGVSQYISGTSFLMGGTPRPNIVPGQDFLTPGNTTDRIRANVNDNVYFNKAAFSTAGSGNGDVFGNAPIMLPGVESPHRNNVDLSVSKRFNTGGGTSASFRMEVLNIFNIVQWAAPDSNAFGRSTFGQISSQANNMRMIQFTFRFSF